MNNLVKVISKITRNKPTVLRLCQNNFHIRHTGHASRIILRYLPRSNKEQLPYLFEFSKKYGLLAVSRDTNIERKKMSEVEYARTFFENSEHYSKTIVSPRSVKVFISDDDARNLLDKNWSSAKAEELLLALQKLSYHYLYNNEDIHPEKYENILNGLTREIKSFNINMLKSLLEYLIVFEKKLYNFKPYTQLFVAVDLHCSIKYTKWETDDLFLITDLFTQFKVLKPRNILWLSTRKLGSKMYKITPKQFVRLMFLISITRQSNVNMYEAEVRLQDCLSDLSVNELGIIAMGYFKSKNKITNPTLLSKILTEIIKNIELIEDITLTAILKIIRYSTQLKEVPQFRLLLLLLVPQIEKRSLACTTHIAQTCAKLSLCEKSLIDAIMKRLNDDIKSARIKDFERILHCLISLNLDDDKYLIYDNIIQEIEETRFTNRENELKLYPHVLPRILAFLTYKNIYPTKLIEHVMSHEYIQHIKLNYLRDIAFSYIVLYFGLKIDVPDYTGPTLSERLFDTFLKHHNEAFNHEVVKGSKLQLAMNEIIHMCKDLFNVDPHIIKILPHYNLTDIVIGLDENKNIIPITTSISSGTTDNTIKYVDKEFLKNNKAIVIMPILPTHILRNTTTLNGVMNARIKQLTKIGYTPVTIPHFKWINLQQTGKQTFLKDSILNA